MPDNDYGKTLFVPLSGAQPRLFTLGHRNPQGLYVERNGNMWLTEHGPQGGDELNALTEGANYGWPFHTYGKPRDGRFTWPLSAHLVGMKKPVYAWVPSVAISSVIVVEGSEFPQWKGDLLLGSLRGARLHRMHFEDGRVAYEEPIRVNERIRDLTEGLDGRIVLWTDNGTIVSVTRAKQDEGAALFQQCAACHPADGSQNGIGPNLRGVYGRAIASKVDYSYSTAMRAHDGKWDEGQLNAFLADPAAFAPGTSMAFEGIADDWQRRSLIEYLRNFQ